MREVVFPPEKSKTGVGIYYDGTSLTVFCGKCDGDISIDSRKMLCRSCEVIYLELFADYPVDPGSCNRLFIGKAPISISTGSRSSRAALIAALARWTGYGPEELEIS